MQCTESIKITTPISHPYKLKGHILITENTTKYLGVDLQTALSWKTHIDRISKKTNNMLMFLRRTLRSCSEDTKANAYFSMVRSNLEYWSSVWNPHQKDQILKLEMIQRRDAQYTSNRCRNTSSVFSITFNGSLLNQGVPKFNWPFCTKLSMIW